MTNRRKIKIILLVLIFAIIVPFFAFRIFSCECCVEVCDYDKNGFVGSDDAIYLLRNTLSPDKYPIAGDGDVNGDGIKDSDDAIYLLRHTLDPEKYPIKNTDKDSYNTEMTEIRTNVKERTNRPTEFKNSSSYEDIIFYGISPETNRERFEALPSGNVIIDDTLVLTKGENLKSTHGNTQIVNVNDNNLPFEQALRVNVTDVPSAAYGYQLGLGQNVLENKISVGNAIMIRMFVRAVNEGESGRIELIIEQNGGNYNKILKQQVDISDKWEEIYAPTEYANGYTSVNIRFGLQKQSIEIGGFELVDYGSDVEVSDMPITMSRDSFSEGVEWRDEALARIDQVRKGDIKVVVTDKDGNPISDALTEIEMYEHEFEWGTAISNSGTLNKQTLEKVSSLFNSAVLENELKWSMYESNKQRPKTMIEKLNEVGIYNVRGHCLVWDRVRRENDTSVPLDLPDLYNDRKALTERINSHIEEVMGDMEGYITEWDVLNEACNNTKMQDIYGRELIKEWFDMARDTGIDVDLYYNDFMMTDQLFSLLDTMENLGVDYDGIGVQSHYGSVKNIEDISKFYERLSAYGKKLKVTEYDFATSDSILQAEFTRDLMILTFSFENFEGFYLWGIKGGDGNRYVCYDSNWNPRPALEQMQDLIYNKWMTIESSRTDENGVAKFSGFYGSYKISVVANGVKKTVLVDCHKGNDNTVCIELP